MNRKDERVTISVTREVAVVAQQRAKELGLPNAGAFIANLVEQDSRRQQFLDEMIRRIGDGELVGPDLKGQLTQEATELLEQMYEVALHRVVHKPA